MSEDKPQEFDCEYTDEITCPFCGYVEKDSWEYNFKQEHCDLWCNQCDSKISVYQHITIKYSSYKGWEN